MTSVIDRARLYVSKIPPAVSGSCGHSQLFVVALVLVHGFDLSESDALLAVTDYNASCVPPWSTAELLHKIRSAAQAPSKHLLVLTL